MTSREIAVLLEGVRAGTITETNGRLRLRYDDSYCQLDATPLSVSMPIQVAEHGHGPVAAFLWGLLPDNDSVLQRWGQTFQVSPSNAAALLSTPIGADCAGAAQFATLEHADALLERAGSIDWLEEGELAQRLRDLSSDPADWHGARRHTGQFSLAGAQAKTALRYDSERDRWGVPHGREPTTHILKPGVRGFDQLALNEHICLATARRMGLLAARMTIRRFEDQTVVVVERFDRARLGDGSLVRVHQEDLCQALAVHPTRRYQHDGGPGVADIGALVRRLLPRREAIDALERFVDALLFNWLICGTDAHAKNYGLLLSGQQIRLAPLYDVASMLPYESDPLRLHLAMKVGGTYRLNDITAHVWHKLANELDLDTDRVLVRARKLGELLPDALAEVCGAADVVTAGGQMPAKLQDAVARWCQRKLKGLRRYQPNDA